ncbi:MAG: hypothetical protein AAGB93_06525 [Planctomycetota bacterium]
MGETYRLARFEHRAPESPNATLVSHEGFFTDIPGFENLAEGNSAKALGSLSLARQGRYFYWGYSIDPESMTEGAGATLVNVLYYMRDKRAVETVPFVCKTRQILEVYTWLGRDRDKPYTKGVEKHLPASLVPALREDYTPTFEGADEFVAKYIDYVYAGKPDMPSDRGYGPQFDVDRDAMALGTPNRERASLERWIDLADGPDGDEKALALRCLERYVHPSLRPAGTTWKAWYRSMDDRLCFIDSTGFWWQLDPSRSTVTAFGAPVPR